jgi:hypothetical protein
MTENEQSPKMYYCEEKNTFCLTDSCAKGKELSNWDQDSQGTILYDGDGYAMEGVPGRITTRLIFKDGTEKYVDGKIGFFKECENND